MKTFLSTLALAILLGANPFLLRSSNPCRMIVDSQTVSLAEKLQSNLQQGVWMTEHPAPGNQAVKLLLQFKNAGRLDFLEKQPLGNYAHQQLHWAIEVRDNTPHLITYELETNRQRDFNLVQTCHGLELTDAKTGEQLRLTFHPSAASSEVSRIKGLLAAEWSNTLYPFEIARNGQNRMPGAFLEYEFRKDGTYTKLLGNNEAQMEEPGDWEISKDGQFLLLHTDAYEGGRLVRKTTLARIKFIMPDEMVLEHALLVSQEKFCTDWKDFYFSRR